VATTKWSNETYVEHVLIVGFSVKCWDTCPAQEKNGNDAFTNLARTRLIFVKWSDFVVFVMLTQLSYSYIIVNNHSYKFLGNLISLFVF
jgi:hypothetical protein